MIYTSADDIAQHYWNGRAEIDSLRALDLRMIRGEICSHCGGGPSTQIVGRYVGRKMAAEQWTVCSDCNKPWEPTEDGERFILRGEIQTSPRPGAAEAILAQRLDRYRHLTPLVEPCPEGMSPQRWVECKLYMRFYVDSGIGTIEQIAVIASVSEKTVDRRLCDFRRVVWGRYLYSLRGEQKTA